MALPPRFLLPLRSYRESFTRQNPAQSFALIRHASTRPPTSSRPPPRATPSTTSTGTRPPIQTNTLAKPDRYRPPSHPAHIPKAASPINHGGDLTAEEKERQSKKRYPNMMPPRGTFSHWFLTTRSIHLFITLGVLTSLTVWTISTKFKNGYPHLYMLLPTSKEWAFSPLSSASRFMEVVRLHAYERTEEARQGRKIRVDDSFKRSAYNKAHGIQDNPFLDSIGLKKEDGPRTGPTLADQKWGRGTEERGVQFEAARIEAEAQAAAAAASQAQAEATAAQKSSRKWFGLW